MSMLQGKIVFQLELDESSIEITASRKRKRPVENQATKKQNDALPVDGENVSGFLFFPTRECLSVDDRFDCYLLAVPQQLARRVSEAAAYDLPVAITRYAVVPLKDQKGRMRLAFLEVWSDGLRLLRQAPMSLSEEAHFWSLSHFRRREIVEKTKMKTSHRKELYNIIATVDAISPILPLDPDDPFCLVELYDANHDEHSCVLVLNGHDALIWQSAMRPGETLQFEGLQRKPWQVPEAFAAKPSFQHLVGRIPSFVFVFSASSKVFWPSNSDNSENYVPSFPSTPIPLVSMEGIILSIERKALKRGTKTIQTTHRIVVECDGESNQKENPSTYLLLLTHFPMSVDLQLGLQCGTRIRAVNVHPIEGSTAHHENGMQAYGACIRSTVSLLRTSSEEQQTFLESQSSFESNEEVQHFHTQQGRLYFCSSTEERSIDGVVPYRIGKVKLSYRDMVFKRHAAQWRTEGFDGLDDMDEFDSLPSTDDLLILVRSESSGKTKKSGGTRNPYAEFFDHAFHMDSCEDRQNTSCGCSMTQAESNHQSVPCLVGLNDVRMAGLRILGRRFAKLSSCGSISKGWSGSIHLPINEIARELGVTVVPTEIYVGGFACATTHNKEIVSVSDRICQLSFRFSDPTSVSTGDFMSGKLISVVVSCFCVLFPKGNGTSSPADDEFHDSINVQSLPPLGNTRFDNVMGGGALVRLGNYILVASVQLRCSIKHRFGCQGDVESGRPIQENLADNKGCSIEACLRNPRDWNGSSATLKGIVMRSRFRHAKVNSNGLSNCLVMTLSHASVRGNTSVPSFLQTIDLKIDVPHSTSKTIVFKRVLADIISQGMQVLEDECALGISWWIVAESCQTSPLVAGGWDEWNGTAPSWSSYSAVVLSFPSDSLSTSDRGYVRWSCGLDALNAVFVQTNQNWRGQSLAANIATSRFDFIGRGKVFDGMLCRRPARKSIRSQGSARCIGELLDTSLSDCISPCNLSNLFILACQSIRSGDPHVLAPSMVRRLSRAKFLGVAFCCAECKCSRCLQPLVADSIQKSRPLFNPSATDDVEEKSFWHLPDPGGLTIPNVHNPPRPQDSKSERCPPHIKNSSLRCPNKCDVEHYTVNWECSGFVDDGTGQAKLYAEREAALTLLGFPKETVDKIEQAMWETWSGTIRYTKSIPPTNQLQEQVKNALSKSRKAGQCPLEFLQPAARAEYLLYQHCRTSSRPTRKLDYFVRCKPLSDSVSHLNHTTVESFVSSEGGRKLKSFSEAASYSLPPIKLELVDCRVPMYN